MIHLNVKFLRLSRKLSESALAAKASLSRLTVRQVEHQKGNPTLGSLAQLASSFGRELCVLMVPLDIPLRSESSSVSISLKVQQDGFDSWPFHFMELVDDFRRTGDMRLLLLPPVKSLNNRLQALLASIVCYLCQEQGLEAPDWAKKSYFLDSPWFLSGIESLKALALRDSPIVFRRNNIFVQDNFLMRT